MTKKLKLITLAVFIILTLICYNMGHKKKEQNIEVPYGVFDFYFYESTGDNMFIDINMAKKKITFDRDLSDKDALKSLSSLKWNVLYPNSKGIIKVYGQYKEQESAFILQHWWLKPPFKLYTYLEEPLELNRMTQKEKLTSEDFEIDLDINPSKYNSELTLNK